MKKPLPAAESDAAHPDVEPRRWHKLSLIALAIGATAALAGPAPSFANHAAETCTKNSTNGVGCITVSDSPDPVSYSSFDGNDTFLRYRAVVTNRSQSGTLSHVQIREALPDGTSCLSAVSNRGSVSCSGQTVSGTIGQLKKGQAATIDVEVTAPATSDPNPAPTTLTNVATVSFASNNPNDPGKDVSASYAETTTVKKDAGQTYCPQGEKCQVNTDPDQLQYANVLIPDPKTDLLVTLRVLPADGFCVLGQVAIEGNLQICRNGGFVEAFVTEAQTGDPYHDLADPLVFHLRWEQPLVSLLQTEDNFVVFYRSTLSGPTSVFGALCDTAASNLPCLRNVTEDPDGAWSTDLVKPDNGYMR